MTTKDYHSSDKTDNLFCQPNNDQYNNLNLNQNYQSFHSDKIQSKSAFTKSKKVQNYDLNDLQAKKDLNSWNKSSKHLSSNFLNLNRESEEEQCDLKKSKSANNSTLSLHIAAYENSVEDKADSKSKSEKTALIKKWNNTKQGFIDSLSFAQNPFEFPRQQEEQSNPPEVMQFKASQRLRNPNKEHLNFDKKSDKVAPLQPNHRPKSVDIQPIHCALRDSTMNTNYDIELSSNDSDNDSDSNETFTGGEKSSKAKIKYLRFSPDALKYISVGHKFSAKNPTKFTSKGTSHNMCFKMIKSDSRLVKSMLYSYGFTQCSRKNANVNFIWANTHMNGTTLRTFHPWQRINHFPRSVSITKKDMLHQNLSTMKKCFGACYDFYPESFILPDEKEILDAHYADKETVPPLISKPASASRGRGIQIVTDLKQIESIEAHEKSKVVLSEYISNPYLVNGRKFDLRLYVTVISFQPLIVYMFNDGLARFAVDEYTDDDTDFTETFKHLTNYSLNKFSENFIKNNDPTQEDIGHKWTVSALLRHLSKEGIDTKLLMVRMEDIVIKTLLSIQHHVSAAIRSTGLGPNVCFELFGFDILIDNDLKPWLLEVNLSPSLACDAPLDSILKTRVLCDTLNLAMVPLLLDINGENVVAGDEENLNENNDNDAVSSASASSLPASRSSSPLVFTKRGKAPFRKSNSLERRKPYNPAARVKIYSNRLKLEKTRKGNFVRIFPRKDTFYLYKHMIEELDYRHEKQDMLLFKTMYGEDPETFEIAGDVDDYHKQLMDAKNYKRTSDLSSETAEFLQEALDEAAEYEAEKHPNGFRIYPKSLPRLHPYARRRTSSQVIADEVRRQARLESLIIKPLEQELLRVASSSSSTSKVLSDVKTAV